MKNIFHVSQDTKILHFYPSLGGYGLAIDHQSKWEQSIHHNPKTVHYAKKFPHA